MLKVRWSAQPNGNWEEIAVEDQYILDKCIAFSKNEV